MALLLFTPLYIGAQPPAEADGGDLPEIKVDHPECVYFGPKHAEIVKSGLNGAQTANNALSELADRVTALLVASDDAGNNGLDIVPGGSRTNTYQRSGTRGTIDRYLFAAMQQAGVTPAVRSNDYEFIRRVTLDLTGRIPTPDRVQSFVADSSANKRAALIDELLAKPEWVDKWVMYYGDLFNNTTDNTTTGVKRYADGRNAFYAWLKQSIAANRPYNSIASDLISVQGTNSYDPAQGHLNWIVNGLVTNGPSQDAYDQEAANTAETFLGISHLNCTLCHNGRGHLDALSLWGKNQSRVSSWGLAAFFGRTVIGRTAVDAAVNNQPYYWHVDDSGKADYQYGTLTGNRPARCMNNLPPVTVSNVLTCGCADGTAPTVTNGRASCRSGFGTAAAVYPFSGRGPKAGESYRVALAREVTSDFQFARASVNYLWKEFFGRGIVDPVNQFDLARLDPDNPPPDPWTLQPSNPQLLNALAQDFINNGYDIKALMKQIANSDAYQLSSRYNGVAPDEKLFARKLVRRLWGEEIHDAIAQSSNILPSYRIASVPNSPLTWAMQLPEPRNLPGGTTTAFLDSFLRGNRDDEDRRGDPALTQALNLMDDSFVMTRIRATGTGANASLLAKSLPMPNDQLVDNLFLTVLSRFPTDAEKKTAIANLASGSGTAGRQQKAENLLWSLYNKVDFIFNY
ncbi:MAG: DUF1549 domain-containing protein [Bryobacteraceae bacterium]